MDRASLLRRVKDIYADRRNYADRKTQLDQVEFLDAHPELAQKLNEIEESRWDQLQAIIQNAPNKDFTRFLEGADSREDELSRLEQVAGEETIQLEDDSLYKEYLEIEKNNYQCEHCKDLGRKDNVNCAICFSQVWRRSLEEIIPDLLASKDGQFENFDLNIFSEEEIEIAKRKISPRKQMQSNVKLAKDFVKNFPQANRNLYLTGKAGTGKTFLAECIANALINENKLVVVLTSLDYEGIINTLRVRQSSYSTKAEELERARAAYNLLIDADLLVIDDFGVKAGILSNPLAEILALLRERKLKSKQTIITSNFTLDKIKQVYDERLLSRILEVFTMVPFVGDDIRIKRRR